MKRSKNNIDTGKLLRGFVAKKKITNTDLGRDINRNANSIYKYKENISIQTGILIDICHATKHNFFQDIAHMLPEDFTITKPADNTLLTEKDQLIAQLQEENKMLKMENGILLKLRG